MMLLVELPACLRELRLHGRAPLAALAVLPQQITGITVRLSADPSQLQGGSKQALSDDASMELSLPPSLLRLSLSLPGSPRSPLLSFPALPSSLRYLSVSHLGSSTLGGAFPPNLTELHIGHWEGTTEELPRLPEGLLVLCMSHFEEEPATSSHACRTLSPISIGLFRSPPRWTGAAAGAQGAHSQRVIQTAAAGLATACVADNAAPRRCMEFVAGSLPFRLPAPAGHAAATDSVGKF